MGAEGETAPLFAAICVEFQARDGSRQVGAIQLERFRPIIRSCEYGDNEFYNRTESLLVQWGFFEQGECCGERILLISAPAAEWTRIDAFLSLLPAVVQVRRVRGALETGTDFPTVLISHHKFSLSEKQARLINWITAEARLLESGFYGRVALLPHNSNGFIAIDQSALRALSVFDAGKAGESGVFGYISRFLNTRMGARTMREWLCQPLRDGAEIAFRQKFARAYASDADLRIAMRAFLRRLPNIDTLLWRLSRVGIARQFAFGLVDVYRLYSALVAVEGLLSQLKSESVGARLLIKIFSELSADFSDFRTFVEQAIDISRIEQQREYFIAAHNSPRLLELHAALAATARAAEELREELCAEFGVDVGFVAAAKLGFVFEAAKRKVDDALREGRGRFSILTARKTTVTFTTVELNALNERKAALSEEIAREQSELIQEVVRATVKQLSKFESANFIFAEQDALLGLAELSLNPRDDNVFCFPKFDFSSNAPRRLEIEGCWHPCVKSCIANDCLLEDGASFVIITGPNMGGKSTFIRQIALCALLAHVGGPVPARRCTLTPLSSILTRVGAADAQLRGVSTFMAEMIDVSNVFSRANRDALLIVDELGRGTSTYEGLGIAQAVAERLLQEIDCFCLFATHFHELTRLPLSFPNARNCSLQAIDLGTSLEFLYKVMPEPVNQSYGINVIELLGFPNEIVQNSREILSELEKR